jgi:hypothetical protein
MTTAPPMFLVVAAERKEPAVDTSKTTFGSNSDAKGIKGFRGWNTVI